MSRLRLLRLVLLVFIATRLFAGEAPLWSADLEEAQARADGRLLLVSFTGSDWCVWCKRLKEEILTKPHFLNYAKEHLVLVELDFPREKPLTPDRMKQNADWAQKLRVTAYPTILLLTPAGEELGRTGYMQGGPKTFVRELRRLAEKKPAAAQVTN
jgi:thioredoxin-related protein